MTGRSCFCLYLEGLEESPRSSVTKYILQTGFKPNTSIVRVTAGATLRALAI